ncbi:hypothetical protein M8756_05095 [Lutimaribacter sp. EGI FJ00015]|uniref:Uncharacterized protein n=1 Tax=Lutimaribacter degradans TaxID=2945989 RepID=A0ACC5ZU09_9RHOB|nr:hypothetical protein [Lutimaribacter sp. EGI FJ00013]MCM2561615.1 hypothetical protein [Lutimaribacter sp. EGI FJ00013]MCO0612674.1 hypothetical protein [Lutimaribacter sp. EGI FJ00015]MCO0635332.1 hypothetical protein [Lutimaribacter sp. EGI FJ00014]
MNAPDPWLGILEPDEIILWQGRPDARIDWRALSARRATVGAVTTLVAALWIGLAGNVLAPVNRPLADVLLAGAGFALLAVGLFNLFGHVLWDAYRRARTWYTLSDRRAFIATKLPFLGKQLHSYPITSDTLLTFDDCEPASIGFAFKPVPLKRNTRLRMLGFERIHDGRSVYALLRGVQGRVACDRSQGQT